MEEETFTPPQVAKRLRLNHYTILRYIHAGVEAEKVVEGKRNRYFIKKSVLDSFTGRAGIEHTS